jgi:hypothetical protein
MLTPLGTLPMRVMVGSALFAIAFGARAHAQSPDPRTRIRGIVLQRDAVFDSVEAKNWPYRVANALHVETRTHVIRRELLLDIGDPFDSALVAESERNLRALGIFRDVEINPIRTDTGIVIRVRTADAWTTTMGVSIATSGSQSVVDLSLQETNLLGTRTVAMLGYRNDPDRSAITAAFDTPRAIGDRVGVGATIIERSDGRGGTGSLRLPFLSLSSQYGGSLVASVFEGRVLQFLGGTIADSLWREFAILRADGAAALSASPRGYVRVGLLAQYLRDDIVAFEDRANVPHTRSGTAGPYIAARAPRYIRVRNIERIGRIEDIDLGPYATLTLLAAPAAWGYERNGIGAALGAGTGLRLPGETFARINLRASTLQTSDGTDSATVEGALSFAGQRGEKHLTVLHASGGMQKNPVPGREFDLGLGTGLRAFPAHAFTGDRYFVLAGEYRYLVWPRLLGLAGVGVAAFAGHAAAWQHEDAIRAGTEFGLGLRIASIREVGGIWRLDVSRRSGGGFSSGLVFSLGRGFVFGGI